MTVQRIFAFLVGSVSAGIGVLSLFSLVEIPLRDAIIHIITGLLFLLGGLLKSGKYVKIFNLLLGIFYIIFGIYYSNWPHCIAGVIACLIAFLFGDKRTINQA
jgi:hypothetical protein